MTVEEKIAILVERYCRNRSHLADMIGVSPQVVNNWVYRDHIPHRGIEAIISRFPQEDRSWLRGGDASISSGSLPLPAEVDDEDDIEFSIGQPATNGDSTTASSGATSFFAAGMRPSLGEVPQVDEEERLVPVQMPRRDIKFVFRCHGDSMLPRIQDGDYVGVGESLGRYEDFRAGVPYLVQTNDGRFMIKMVQDPGPAVPYLQLTTENPNYQLADGGRLAKSEFRAAYRVIMVMRDL